MLIRAAQASAGWLDACGDGTADGNAALAREATALATRIVNARTRGFGERADRRVDPSVTIGYGGVRLTAWTAEPCDEPAPSAAGASAAGASARGAGASGASGGGPSAAGASSSAAGRVENAMEVEPQAEAAEPAKGKGKAAAPGKGKGKAVAAPEEKKVKPPKKEPWTAATLEIVSALQLLCPPEQMRKNKETFKMAKVVAAPGTGVDRSAAWGGDCGHARGLESR